MVFPGWWVDGAKIDAVSNLFDSVSSSYVANTVNASGHILNKSINKIILSTLNLKFGRIEAFRPPASSFYTIATPRETVKGHATTSLFSETGAVLPTSDIWKGRSPTMVFLNGDKTTVAGHTTFTALCVMQLTVPKGFDQSTWMNPLLSGVLQPGETVALNVEFGTGDPAIKLELIQPAGKSASSWYPHVTSHFTPSIVSTFNAKDIASFLKLKVTAKDPLQLSAGTDYLLWKITVSLDRVLPKDTTKHSFNLAWSDKDKSKAMQRWLDAFTEARVTPNSWGFSYNIDVSDTDINGAPCYIMTNKIGFTIDKAFAPPNLPDIITGTVKYSIKTLNSTTQQHGAEVTITTTPGRTITKSTKSKLSIKTTVPFVYLARARWDSILGPGQVSTAIAAYISPVPLSPTLLNFQADTQTKLGILESEDTYAYVDCDIADYKSAHAPKFAIEHVVLTNTHWTNYIDYFIQHGYPPVVQSNGTFAPIGHVTYTNYGLDHEPGLCINYTGQGGVHSTGDFLDPVSVVRLKKIWKLPYATGTWHVYLLRHRWDDFSTAALKLEAKKL
jgi:hypothetical protein